MDEDTSDVIKVPQPHGGALTPYPKGVSGNPAGKPKGTKHLSSVIQDLMEDENFELKLKNGELLKGMPSRNIAKVMYGLAVSGNTKAADWLARHGYGNKQIHEFENSPIQQILQKYGLDGVDKNTATKTKRPKAVPAKKKAEPQGKDR